MLPAAKDPSSRPEAALAPLSSANATVIRSTEPNTAPIARNTQDSSATPGIVMGLPDCDAPGRAGGSVRRWSAKATVPMIVQTSARISPA